MSGRKATASWAGTLMEGKGKIALGSGLFEGNFSFGTRIGDEPGTNPEEMLSASLAGCYAMALNAALERGGTPATNVNAEATSHLGKDDSGFAIVGITLSVRAQVPGLDAAGFSAIAEQVKNDCPISKALATVKITLNAELA